MAGEEQNYTANSHKAPSIPNLHARKCEMRKHRRDVAWTMGHFLPRSQSCSSQAGEGGRWERGSLGTGRFCRHWFPATCEFGSGIQALNKGLDLTGDPVPVALCCRAEGVACLAITPKGCQVMLTHSLGGQPDIALLSGS